MSLIKKTSILVLLYAIYQLLVNEKYDDLRQLISNRYDEIKPHLLELINNADLYTKFATSVEKEKTQLNIEKKLENLKAEINKINTQKIADISAQKIIDIKDTLDNIKEKISK